MRPVLLEMDGFASFREPTTVDFRGAEYFALVGPTGAGKSTVIDAFTFALYGSVPRWDDRRAVSLALAPTAGRGAVRFVFDAAGARYVVARELRRSASGGVSVRGARLERLRDPDGTGAAGEETEPVADGAGATTKAVEDLLGLPFGDFTTCVVLPQGEFAEFLHAEPRKRQEKLVRILGLGLYDVIAREANTEAATQRQRAEVLAEQLGGYADATEDAEREAVGRVARLDALGGRVRAAAASLGASAGELGEVRALFARLTDERVRLAGLAVPDGLAELDARHRGAGDAVAAARERSEAAEAADLAAREALAAAPARGPLEQARRGHAERAALVAEQPGARERHEKARSAWATAEQDAADARAALDAARAAADAATAAGAAAREALRRIEGDTAALRAVVAPVGLDALAARQDDVAAAVARAAAVLADADAAEAAARAAVAAAPARGPLEQARRDHRDLAAAVSEQSAAAARLASADPAPAEAAVRAARAHLDHARAAHERRLRADLAAGLRASLAVGEPCPVCAQEVATLPGAAPSPGESDDVATAEAALEEAGRRAAAAAADRARAAEAVERADLLVGRLRSALAGVGTAGEVDAALAELDQLVAAVDRATAAARTARAEHAGAVAAADAARAEQAAAGESLRAARDPLVPLGAPPVGADVVAGWRALVTWADAAAAEREAQRAGALAELARAEDEQRSAAGALDAAARAERARRADAVAAARAEQEARGAAERIVARTAELDAELADAPTDAAAAAALARLAELEGAARTADSALRSARADQRSAERAAANVGREVAAAWQALRAARDPLVPLGAPAVLGEDLPGEWTALVAWARAGVGTRDVELAAVQERGRAVRTARDAVAVESAQDLAVHEVVVPGVVVPGVAGPGPGVAGTIDAEPVADAAPSTSAVALAAAGAPASGPAGAGAPPGSSAGGPATGSATGSPMPAARADALATALVEAAPAAVVAALERARAARERVAERRAAAADLLAARDAAAEAQQVAKMLGGLLRSDGFPRWLVASALDALVADASQSLAELSAGQFELTHDNGEFLVVDHADADARRPVKTLSGGETFQASLALALALSAQMSGLAVRGAARLESIFLDEGFGTLDEANLEIVASTLENLATRGDRVVGVITHVPALAERVPVRFVVGRDQRTSSVVREG